jgi:hypothetical protein
MQPRNFALHGAVNRGEPFLLCRVQGLQGLQCLRLAMSGSPLVVTVAHTGRFRQFSGLGEIFRLVRSALIDELNCTVANRDHDLPMRLFANHLLRHPENATNGFF